MTGRATAGQTPIAWVVGLQSHQVKVRCPYCDRIHFHGVALGHRVGHCGLGHRGYYLELSAGLSAKKRAAIVNACDAAELRRSA